MEPVKTIKKARDIATGLVIRVVAYFTIMILVIRWAIPELINLHDDFAAWAAFGLGIMVVVGVIWIVADFCITLTKIDNKDQA